MLAEMSPYLLLGFGIAGLLYAFVPGDFYRNHLSRPGVLSVIKAALTPLPRPFLRWLKILVFHMSNIDIENILNEKGVKPTSNRILVMRELAEASHPVSLADLESLLGFSMDKASIFRVLELFAEKDVVHVIEDGSRSLKYELCHSGESPHTISDQHVHFYCEKCKETYCFEDIKVPSITIPDGFYPHSVNYVIKGICPKCHR